MNVITTTYGKTFPDPTGIFLCAPTVLHIDLHWSIVYYYNYLLKYLFLCLICELLKSNDNVLSNLLPSVQFSSVIQLCLTLCNPMNHSMPGLPVHPQLPEFTQTHVRWVSDAIQPSHPLSSLSPPAPNPSQPQGFFQWVSSSHEVAKVLEFQLQHQFFQWTPRTDLL